MNLSLRFPNSFGFLSFSGGTSSPSGCEILCESWLVTLLWRSNTTATGAATGLVTDTFLVSLGGVPSPIAAPISRSLILVYPDIFLYDYHCFYLFYHQVKDLHSRTFILANLILSWPWPIVYLWITLTSKQCCTMSRQMQETSLSWQVAQRHALITWNKFQFRKGGYIFVSIMQHHAQKCLYSQCHLLVINFSLRAESLFKDSANIFSNMNWYIVYEVWSTE